MAIDLFQFDHCVQLHRSEDLLVLVVPVRVYEHVPRLAYNLGLRDPISNSSSSRGRTEIRLHFETQEGSEHTMSAPVHSRAFYRRCRWRSLLSAASSSDRISRSLYLQHANGPFVVKANERFLSSKLWRARRTYRLGSGREFERGSVIRGPL